MTGIVQDPAFIAALQKIADADHARQPVCSWCGKPGTPFEHNGVRFDGLVACQGDRLCSRCTDSYLENTPLLVRECRTADDPGVLYDLNPVTWEWSEKNIPGCRGEPPVRAIAVANRPEYADYAPGARPRRGRKS
jgi:hypothetical protein